VKSLVAFAALAAAAAVAAPASAQSLTAFKPTGYTAGVSYQSLNIGSGSVGAITIRAGADFGKYFGLEGEGGWGVDDHNGSTPASDYAFRRHLSDQYAGYGVVRYPVYENATVFVRGGFGHTDIKYQATSVVDGTGYTQTPSRDSWNYGAGGQYLVDGKNGVRLDYTHFDFIGHGAQQTADTWSVGYVHKF
jgi:hypothetical protein